MDIIFHIAAGTILITGLFMLGMVFKNEGILTGIICFIVFPLIYIFAVYDYKKYSIPFILHVLGFVGYWMTS